MALLDPRSGLRLVRLEGMNPADVPDDDDEFLGCDLSEYYGADRLDAADRVVLTQLKYSVLHASKPWTASRLRSVKKAGGASVVKRLAQMFERLGTELSADERLSKVAIALVSNQPVDAGLQATLSSAQDILQGRKPGIYAGTAFASLSSAQRTLLDGLRKASGLSSGDFTDFVRILDFTGCGSGSRAMQRITLGRDLSSVTPDGPQAVPALMQFVQSCMMPEAADQAGIRVHDLLVLLGSSGLRSLFPFPPRFTEPATRVPSSQAREVAAAVSPGTVRRVLAHGQPGVGKSTTVATLETHLPAGSIVVAYDCYAAGDYLNPAESRHSVRALVQIINEVALRVGTLPFVVRDALLDEGVLWQQFQDRLGDAAATLSSGALLLVVVDAADNSASAAHRNGERSFVHRLWRVNLPDNVRLVVTARSGRRNDVLQGTDGLNIEQVDIPVFDQATSSAMLRVGFPDATAEQCLTFHSRSRGFARVQAYALGRGEMPRTVDSGEAIDVDKAVKRAGRELSDLFDEVLNTALATIEDLPVRRAQVAALAAMARPAQIPTLSIVLGVDEEHIRSLVRDLTPGLVMADGGVGFSDEDFEQHVRDAVRRDELHTAHARFADHFHGLRLHDAEAAQRLGEHLFFLGRANELVELVLNEGTPSAIVDGLLRAQTYRSRISCALRLLANIGGTPATPVDVAGSADVVRLVLAAADAARTDSSHLETVKAAPELALLHGEPSAVTAILTRDESERWRGKLHMRAAAALAASGRHSEAAEQLSMAEAWIRAWAREPDHSSREFDAADVAHAALAAFVTRGPEHGLRLVAGWKPLGFVAQVTTEFLKLAAGVVPVRDIIKASKSASASSLLQAEAAAVYASAGQTVPASWVRRICRALDRLPAKALRQPPSWGVEFCELALASGVSRSRVRTLLVRLGPEAPLYLSDFEVHARVRDYLKAACLSAACRGEQVDLSALAEALPIGDDRPDYAKRQRTLFKSACGSFSTVMYARAQCLVAVNTSTGTDAAAGAVIAAVRQGLSTPGDHARRHDDPHGSGSREWLRSAAGAVVTALQATADPIGRERQVEPVQADEPADEIAVLLNNLTSAVRASGPSICLQMAKDIIVVVPERGLDLLGEAADGFESAAMPAGEIRDLLIEAATVAQRYDPNVAADLFERAVRAAEGIDADIGKRLRTIAYVAAGASECVDPGLAVGLARGLTGMLEDATPFVYEPDEHLPHRFVLEVAARLDGPAGFATGLRWAHERRIGLEDALTAVLPSLIATHTIEPTDAFWLLRLLGTSGRIAAAAEPIITATASIQPNGRSLAATQIATVADWVALNTNPAQRRAAADAFCKFADRIGFTKLDCITQTRRLADALTDLEPPSDQSATRTSIDWGRVDDSEPRQPLIGTMASIEQDLATLASEYASDTVVIDHLVAAANAVPRPTRTATLDQLTALVDRNVPRGTARCIAATLEKILATWTISPAVQVWANLNLPRFLGNHLPDMFTTIADSDGAYAMSIALPADSATLVPALIEATAAHLNALTATELHAVIRVLSDSTLDERARALVATAALASPVAPANSPIMRQVVAARAARQTLADPPEASVALVAGALWSLLGHEDRRYRWLAAHTVRLLVTLGPGEPLLSELWNLANPALSGGTREADSHSCFRAPDREFFSMSAVHSLLVAIARVANERPEVVAPITARLAACALDTGFPHAAIRELARRAALAVARAHADTLSVTTIDDLEFANTPSTCSISKGRGFGSRDDFDSRFDFDIMDTVPYWFAPLAATFHGVSTADVGQRADAWIIDCWGRSDAIETDFLREHDDDSWELTHHGHGSIPTIEIAPRYLEYHALLCTAGDLADAPTPQDVQYREPDGADEPWQEWLAKYMPQSESLWLADLREPTPVRPVTTGAWWKINARVAGTTPSSEGSHFDPAETVLHIPQELRDIDDDPNMVVVDGSVYTGKHGWTCMAAITSALVTPAAGRSLLHALADDRAQPQHLPYAGTGVSSWDEVDEPGLQLRGWLTEETYDRGGMDRHDPFACGHKRRLVKPTHDIVTALGLKADRSPTRFTDGSGKLATHFCGWAEEETFRRRGQDPDESSGEYLTVRRDLLARLLAELNLSLVVTIHANLSGPRRGSDSHREQRHSATRYLLIRQDGTEEQLNVNSR